MRKFIAFILLLGTVSTSVAQTVNVSGLAPSYVGKSLEVYRIEDYFSDKESLMTSTTVESDSTFSVSFVIEKTQKVVIKSQNNKGFLYVQPNGKYSIFFPDRNKYDPYNPNGNSIELAFYGLDSTDINYKILGFQRWVDHFVGNNFYLKDRNAYEFAESLDRFKTNVQKAYKQDTSTFFKTFVQFTIAGLDNIEHAAERNRYEKHDFYLKHTPIQYENDAYMAYVKNFYQKLMPRLTNQTNEAVYQGVLKESPGLILKALSKEYTLINLRIREMVMVQALVEVYNSGRYPQTNILTILDSVANYPLFKDNGVIAKNLKSRITELVAGGQAKEIVFSSPGKPTKTLSSYTKKHLYLHFVDPNSISNMKEIELLEDIHKRYSDYVQFVTVYKDVESLDQAAVDRLNQLNWDVYALSEGSSVWKNYQVVSFPQYVLIDATGYIVSSPALGPTPNGQYETIDKKFFYLKKMIEQNQDDNETGVGRPIRN